MKIKITEKGWAEQTQLNTGLSDEQLAKPLKKIYDRVLQIVARYPSTKGKYKLLVDYYYRDFHGLRMNPTLFEKLKQLPSPESIGRLFRKGVENGDIEPTEKMLARRKQRERVMAVAMIQG